MIAVCHRYHTATSNARKSALARNACLAIENHAQLEEEIFYPALRDAGASGDVLEKSEPEHGQMRELIQTLRTSHPGEPRFDEHFHALMRTVMHHVPRPWRASRWSQA